MERAWGSADALSTAPLWWVSEAMEAAACDLARTGADADVVPATRTGLVAFQRDLPEWASDGLPHRVRAIQWTSWDATRGDELGLEVGVALYTADRDACAKAGGGIPLAQISTRADEPSRAATAAASWRSESPAVPGISRWLPTRTPSTWSLEPPQSVTTAPLKPHSSRKMSIRRCLLSLAYSPLMRL